jgi:hypothetical protein
MFEFFKRKPKEQLTTADEKLEQLRNLLFPEPEIEMEGDMEFYVDSSVDMNLESVIVDLQEGHNDAVCQKTLKNISDRLYKARKILQAYFEADPNIKYVVVDDGHQQN